MSSICACCSTVPVFQTRGNFARRYETTLILPRSEHVKQAKKREADKKLAALKPDQEFFETVEIPGIEYLKVNINGKGFERNLLWQLTWWQFMYVMSFTTQFPFRYFLFPGETSLSKFPDQSVAISSDLLHP